MVSLDEKYHNEIEENKRLAGELYYVKRQKEQLENEIKEFQEVEKNYDDLKETYDDLYKEYKWNKNSNERLEKELDTALERNNDLSMKLLIK